MATRSPVLHHGAAAPRRTMDSPRDPRRSCLFDAVLFDLDGTLIATELFWVQAARAGARRAFEELGLEREPPSSEEWMSLVGHPLEEGFERLFADLDPGARARVREACSEEEQRLLSAGGAVLMPGAEELLAGLRAQGIRIGVASNCPDVYLEHMLEKVGLGRWVEEARCLDSPGVRTKADMIADLLRTFGTRSAVMVGDRLGDRNAAWSNGVPHVHCSFGYAPGREIVEAEGSIEDLGELAGLLSRRRAGIERAISGLLDERPRPPLAIGVSGPTAAGKSLFARDLATVLRARGPVELLPLETRPEPGGGPAAAIDPGRFADEVLAAYLAGEPAAVPPELGRTRIDPGSLLVLEGGLVSEPAIRTRLDRWIHLEAPDDLLLRRIMARGGEQALLRTRAEVVGGGPAPGLDAGPGGPPDTSSDSSSALADLVVDGSNPLDPVPLQS